MTANQINAARQREEGRHNLETERQGRDVIQETGRHNRETERIGWGNVGVGYAQVAEAKRHNMATERVNWYDATSRRELQGAQASLARAQAKAAQDTVDIRKYEADIKQREADLRKQSIKVSEDMLVETRRHNRINEDVSSYNVGVNWYDAQSRRQQIENQNWFNQMSIAEQTRHNKRQENVSEKQATYSGIQAVSSAIGTVFGRQGMVAGIGALVGGAT